MTENISVELYGGVCRRCAVYLPADKFVFVAPTKDELREKLFKHLVEVHPNRAVKLMSLMGGLLGVTDEYLYAALRDHNTEGPFDAASVQLKGENE